MTEKTGAEFYTNLLNKELNRSSIPVEENELLGLITQGEKDSDDSPKILFGLKLLRVHIEKGFEATFAEEFQKECLELLGEKLLSRTSIRLRLNAIGFLVDCLKEKALKLKTDENKEKNNLV